MNGYFGSLIRRTGLSVASRDPEPFTSALSEEGNRPHPESGGPTEETVEIVAPRPEPMLERLPPRPDSSRGLGEPAGPQAQESIASRSEESEAQRADSPRESRIEERTGIEGHFHSTVLPGQTADAARAYSPMRGEPPAFSAIEPPDTPPSIEQHATRKIGDSGSSESPAVRALRRDSKAGSTFERAQVWHETYQVVRDWVSASPSAGEVSESIERHGFVESPGTGPVLIGAGIAPAAAAAESPLGDPSANPEIHVSIGTISVVVEEPAAAPQALQQARPMRQERATPPDWTRLRRLYIR